MAELGKKIAWKAGLGASITAPSQSADAVFSSFLNFCEGKVPNQQLKKECELFEEQRNHIQDEYQKFVAEIGSEPLIAAFLVWVKEVGYRDAETLEGAKMLLEQGLIGLADDKGRPWTLEKAKGFDHRTLIDTIRSHKEWALPVRENVVKAYLSFISWLSSETYSYITRLEDPDIRRSQGRALPYSSFISFLVALPNDKSRLVASLLYYGGSRTLDEILQLTIKNVDFEKGVVYFESTPVSYPEHVFNDIKTLVKPRTSGKLFLGRQSSQLNPATIFRNFKEAALKSGLGALFTPACLTASQ